MLINIYHTRLETENMIYTKGVGSKKRKGKKRRPWKEGGWER